MNKVILEAFKNVGVEEISTLENDTIEVMRSIFKEYPNKFFTQAMFVTGLKKSNPFINHQLHTLINEAFIKRGGTKRLYHYKLSGLPVSK